MVFIKSDKREATFLTDWKSDMYDVIKSYYGQKYHIDKEKIMKYLDDTIQKKLDNKKAAIVNNYTGTIARTDILSIFDLVENNELIIGGGGTLFIQHDVKENPIFHYINMIKSERSKFKKERSKYDKNSYEWLSADVMQLIYKIIVNSLYGVTGYRGFVLYNRFIAEAVTNQGRQILSTAACSFENFLGDSINFDTESEVFEFLNNVHNEYKEKYKGKLDTSIFDQEFVNLSVYDKAFERILGKCIFEYDQSFIMILHDIILNKDKAENVLLYYKNNLTEFNKNQFIKDKYKYLIDNIDELLLPEISAVKDEKCRSIIQDIWDFYETFVLYNYQLYDRVRKNMYLKKKTLVGEDTDSNFIGLNRLMVSIKTDIMHNQFNKPEEEANFIIVNIITYFLGIVVDKALKGLCKGMHVHDEFAKILGMKNEFYFKRMLFTDKKKRYISNAILQEGQLLCDGNGSPEIKGFDFKKSTVKPFVTDFFTDICLNDILQTDHIEVDVIFKKMLFLKDDIENSMRKGENKYFKQANVQIPEHYKRPYSAQGLTSVYLWNALCPLYAVELPIDVDIIPIKDLRNKKNMEWFRTTYPEAYGLLERNILNSTNPQLANIGLKYIAKPKNNQIPLPPWFEELVNPQKVVSDMLSLFYPILESLGLHITNIGVTKMKTHMTNIIDL